MSRTFVSPDCPLACGPADWRAYVLAVFAALLVPLQSHAQGGAKITEPAILSVHPSGARPGETVQIEVRGHLLDGAHAIWFEDGGLVGRVLTVEQLQEDVTDQQRPRPEPKEKPQPIFRVGAEVTVPPLIRPAKFKLRVQSPRGLSSGLPFEILDEPVFPETTNPHSTAKQAQPVNGPAVIFAKIAKPGEVDFYRLSAKKGQALAFEVNSARNFDPRLALYRPGGSWFDADRPTRILFEEERTSDLMFAVPRASFVPEADGDYLLEVSSLFGKGGADCTYQLRIAPGRSFSAPPPSADWVERTFSRELDEKWIESLARRGVEGAGAPSTTVNAATARATGGASPTADVTGATPTLSGPLRIFRGQEPDDLASQAVETSLPAIMEGAIEHPGDLDSFRFKIDASQKLVVEIETPEVTPPHFNPRIGVIDLQDHEYFSNVDRRLSMFNNNADPHVFLKAVSARSTYKFERGGEYVLQIRDITSRYGRPGYRYRILVRQEVPHIGEISVEDADQLNLRRGEPRRLAITAQFEEGYAGDIVFSVDGLPPGVEAHPAMQYRDIRAPLEVAQNPEVVLPTEQKAALILLASPDAPLTREPVVASLRCRPAANGKLGPSLLVRSIPIMIVAGQAEEEEAK